MRPFRLLYDIGNRFKVNRKITGYLPAENKNLVDCSFPSDIQPDLHVKSFLKSNFRIIQTYRDKADSRRPSVPTAVHGLRVQ